MRTPRTPCSRLDQEDAALAPPLAKPTALLQAVLKTVGTSDHAEPYKPAQSALTVFIVYLN